MTGRFATAVPRFFCTQRPANPPMRAVEALQMDGKRDECPEVDSLDDADPTRRVGIRAYGGTGQHPATPSNPCRQSWRGDPCCSLHSTLVRRSLGEWIDHRDA